MTRIIVAGDEPLEIGSIETLNLYNAYEKRRIDTACEIKREATFDEFVSFLSTLDPPVKLPRYQDERYLFVYEAEIMD